MCLDTTETAGFPEPFSSPAGGQKCTSMCRCLCVFQIQHVVVFVCVIACMGLINSQIHRAPSACTMFVRAGAGCEGHLCHPLRETN